jgi:hypothetical protein
VKGVLYYNHGERCLVRLLVSLHTLRRYYQGSVTVAAEGVPPEWFARACKELSADILGLPVCHDYGLLKKSRLWRITPYHYTMFIDADTVVTGPVDEFFQWIEEHGVVVTRFCDWRTFHGRMARRIKQWAKIAPDLMEPALRYGWAVNTGVQGWTKGHPLLPAYEELTERGLKWRVAKKTLDEIAMQLLIPKHSHFLADSEWNESCTYGRVDQARIVHYHGHKHCRQGPAGDLWKEEFWELARRFPEYRKSIVNTPKDASIELWLEDQGTPVTRRRDVTVVTAVNPAYADRARKNLPLWLKLPGLKDQKFIVFVNGFKNAKERAFLDLPNVKVVRWDYPHQATARETMLAAFVLGVPKHVSTEYWMKLDVDSAPTGADWEWPEYRKQTIVSHKWGYTKMKGDPDATEHWFTRLDKIFSPEAPYFQGPLDVKNDWKVSHRPGNKLGIPMRFGSFCHIERTAFSRRIADIVRDRCSGRLPIPSHDTIAWYCAALWKEPVKLVNMKKFFIP